MRKLLRLAAVAAVVLLAGCRGDQTETPLDDRLDSVTNVTVTVDKVTLFGNSTATFDFTVAPSSLSLTTDINSSSFPFAIAVADQTPSKGESFDRPAEFRLTSVYPVFSDEGGQISGRYRACIADNGSGSSFQKSFAVVVQRSGKVVCASTPFTVTSVEQGELLKEFRFDSSNNSGVQSFDCTVDTKQMTVTGRSTNVIDMTSLVATFVVAEGVKVYVGTVLQSSGKSANDFSKGVTYRLVTENGLEELYEVSITNLTGLPILIVNTDQRKGVNDRVTWVTGKLTLRGSGEFDDLIDTDVSIRGRGNATWSYPKKPYALKFESRTSVAGMPKQKRWVLLANWMDKTLLRNWAAFEAASMTSMAWSPRSVFVELVLNGRHLGTYQLTEQIRIDKNRVAIDELTADDKTGEAVTGGYLLELDTYYDEVNKFRSSVKGLPVMIKQPDEDVLNSEQFAYIRDYFNNLEKMLSASDMASTRKYADYLDVDSYIDWWLVHELTGNWEPKHPKSVYMYKARNGKIFAGPVWDFDWGTFTDNCEGYSYSRLNLTDKVWYGMLFADPEFKARAKVRWSKLKPEFLKLSANIDAQYSAIEVSASINEQMWPLANQSYTNGDERLSTKEAVKLMRSKLSARISVMDALIEGL